MIPNELEKLLRQAGVDQNLYNTGKPGFQKNLQRPGNVPVNRNVGQNRPVQQRPKALDVAPLQEEFRDPEMRIDAIKKSDEDKGLKLIYQWTRTGSLPYDEFEDLLAEIVRKIRPKL